MAHKNKIIYTCDVCEREVEKFAIEIDISIQLIDHTITKFNEEGEVREFCSLGCLKSWIATYINSIKKDE